MAVSSRHSMDRSDSMHKLQLLSSQQEVLRRRLTLRVPLPTPLTPTSPSYRPLSSSPTTCRHMDWSASPDSKPPSQTHTSTSPIPTEPGLAHSAHSAHSTSPTTDESPHSSDTSSPTDESQHSADKSRLCAINQQIKATLTELLNTESVRNDDSQRVWIQERLMNVEHQIRRQRRRHSSGDREMAETIATSLSPDGRWRNRL